jgi:23S rRNA (adenine1618-N6)-methyltransferase
MTHKTQAKKKAPRSKTGLHERNPHRSRYNFSELIELTPALKSYVKPNRFGDDSINFADPHAVKELNRAILKKYYHISWWDIPDGYLCPPVPGRADYIHNLADLLARSNEGTVPEGKKVSVLDIGVGANCIYPIVGAISYGWRFTGSDIDPVSVASSKNIVVQNEVLKGLIEIRVQSEQRNFFKGIVQSGETYDLTMCNPPFHSSMENAQAGTRRKRENLHLEKDKTPLLNFGGQANELCCPGGEESFVSRMVKESKSFGTRCLWFTSLVSKKATLDGLYKTLKKAGALEVRTINMSQGNKVSRIIAWTFLSKEEHREWSRMRWKS